MQPDEKWNEPVKSIKETVKTLTIVFPFQGEGLEISQIYELYPQDKTDHSVATPTEPLKIKPLSERDNEVN
jgi:hypothetical protein